MSLRETPVSRSCDEGCEETYGNTHTHTHRHTRTECSGGLESGSGSVCDKL